MDFSPPKKRKPCRGLANAWRMGAFSLIEILVVITMASILLTLSAPALRSINSAGQFNQNVADMAGLLEQSRQLAVTQNTYVYVAFASVLDGQGNTELLAAILASKDGTDPGLTGDTAAGSWILVEKVHRFPQLRWVDADAMGSMVKLPSTPEISDANNVAACDISLPDPRWNGTAAFTRAVVFRPTGEARNGTAPIDVINFGLYPRTDPKNAAAFCLNGLTGHVQIYRP